MNDFYRVCAKIYAPEPEGIESDAAVFVPIFHEWIREGAFDAVLFDVADYAHTPDSPGIMLVTHEASFAMDRSDGRFGLHVQRRRPIEGDGVDALSRTLAQAIQVAALLEADPRLVGKLKFDGSVIRVESNDRLRAPNSEEGYRAFEPAVRQAVERVLGDRETSIERIPTDPRDRLTLEVRIASPANVQEYAAVSV